MTPRAAFRQDTPRSAALWVLFGRVFTAASALLINIGLARVLDKAELGVFFLLQSVILIGATVARFGIQQTIVRVIAEALSSGVPGNARAVIRHAAVVGGSGAVVLSMLLLFGGFDALSKLTGLPDLDARTRLILCVWLIALALHPVTYESLRGMKDLRATALLENPVLNLLVCAVVVGFWLTHVPATLVEVLATFAGATLVVVAAGAWLLATRMRALQWGGSLSMREVISQAAPVLVVNLSTLLLTQAHLWILGIFSPETQVATFGAAQKLVAVLSLPLLVVNLAIQPFIAEYYYGGRIRGLETLIRGGASLIGIPVAILTLGFIALPELIATTVYGVRYQDAGPVLMVMSLGTLVNVLSGSCGQVLIFTGHQRHIAITSFVSGLLSIGLGLVFVRSHGALGVAVAFSVGMVVQNMWNWGLVRSMLRINTAVSFTPSVVRICVTAFLSARERR